ncbi:branched-chain amino acid transport system II carrier protein [Alginatibacterium sediminis]|uniref:Branched-chain amino acid transport system carrier protein n=1 Tax=Alginatibacterium sediminis TaxID=2164068 RepID=A0A420E851_9ALTE|nr:branched-chain amino acid transport system II carrier protein [Alginatibacterium sediminis]RKF15656.1 branched-chain amino acid transport system II carrier protein [Alginatibacterium sediminis]
MNKTLGPWNTISLGLMVFAFFLGAGNLIFPPLAGLLAGENLGLAILGFLLTAVGLPLLALLAIAKAGGGLTELTRLLPKPVGRAISLMIYFVLVPGFGIPRTCLVAYELGFAPFFDEPSQLILFVYSAFYFFAALALVLRRDGLLDSVGKVITPVLIICIGVLGYFVFVTPFSTQIPVASGDYAIAPITTGFLEGYNTMDALAALMFGVLMTDALREKGINDKKSIMRYLSIASVIAALGLSLFYVVLFNLGVTASGLAPGAQNGGEIIVPYVAHWFGTQGQFLLTAIVTLACFTTAVGGISAFSSYIEKNSRLAYKHVAIGAALVCAIVANVGLTQLLGFSIPILVGVYPIAMALIALNLASSYFKQPRQAFGLVVAVATIFGVLDGAKTAGLDMSMFRVLPGFDLGLAWALPTLIAFVIALLMPAKQTNEAPIGERVTES